MEMKESYIHKVQEQMNKWKIEITTLQEKIEKAEAQTRIEYNKRLDNTKEKMRSAETNLKNLEEAGAESWKDIKIGYDKILKEIEESIANAQLPLSDD